MANEMNGTDMNSIAIESGKYGYVSNVEGKSSTRHKLSRNTSNRDMAISVALVKLL
jgi:hypothetical protein